MMMMKVGAILVAIVAVRAVYAADIVVGGESGWSQAVDYGTWAAGQTIRVGDSLVFNYGGSHTVDEVDEASYKACSSNAVIKSHSGGKTSIPLSTAGPKYFICPTPGHCASGMKLQVNVLAANSSSATPPPAPQGSSPTPPSPSAAPAPAPAFFNLNHYFIFAASIATLFLL